jgi:hypothetical protein
MRKRFREAEKRKKLEARLKDPYSKRNQYHQMAIEGIIGQKYLEVYAKMLEELGQMKIPLEGDFLKFIDIKKDKIPKREDYQNLRKYYCKMLAEYKDKVKSA